MDDADQDQGALSAVRTDQRRRLHMLYDQNGFVGTDLALTVNAIDAEV
ncbi:MAG TPA: hypothetical protein VH595_06540 [Verrucomicrobiae bacterium]|nr:hypothetical protein [Verrucomicrobiae bacterium]